MRKIIVRFKGTDSILKINDVNNEYDEDKLDAFLKYGKSSEILLGYIINKINVKSMEIVEE